MFVCCSPVQNEQSNKSASKEYEIPTELTISLKDCLSQVESEYLIFFHSKMCTHCQEIKGDVLSFSSENILKTYFLDIMEPNNEVPICIKEEIVIGVTNYEDIKILGTPTIIKVENGKTTMNVGGKENCLTLLNEERMNSKKQNIVA